MKIKNYPKTFLLKYKCFTYFHSYKYFLLLVFLNDKKTTLKVWSKDLLVIESYTTKRFYKFKINQINLKWTENCVQRADDYIKIILQNKKSN